MIIIFDLEIVCKVVMFCNQGMEKCYVNEYVGFNNCMIDIYVFIGWVQLIKLVGWIKICQENVVFLLFNIIEVIIFVVLEGYVYVYYQYMICFEGVIGEECDCFVIVFKEEYQVGLGVYYLILNYWLLLLVFYVLGLELLNIEKVVVECVLLLVYFLLFQVDCECIVVVVNICVKVGV